MKRPTVGIPYHSNEERGGVWGTVCPRCNAWFASVRKDAESFRMSPEAYAHWATHEDPPAPIERDLFPGTYPGGRLFPGA